MSTSLRRRPLPLILALVLAIAAIAAVLAGGTGTAHATPASTASTAQTAKARTVASHPFSDPVWLPLHSAFGLDCVRTNPGCRSPHKFWQTDIVPSGQFGPDGTPSHADVYAMGAGIVHIGDAHGTRCGSGAPGSYGTWIWIDHGAGVLSRYGHLSRILVHNGQYVAAGQAIGVVGATGKGGNCSVNYLDFMVEHNGLAQAHSVQLPTLQACQSGARETWPTQASTTRSPSDAQVVRYDIWNEVHQGTQFPASDGSCIPATPATTAAPGVSARVSGSHLSVGWSVPAGATSVMVEFSRWYTGVHRWDTTGGEIYRSLSAGTTSTSFTGIQKNHHYRVRVSTHDAAGWNSSSWRTVTG